MRYTGFLPTFGKDTPMRLSKAARLAFPDGSVTATALRKEAKRGRLVIERIAGRDFTTMQHIEEMRKKCRVEPRAPAFTSGNGNGPQDRGSGSLSTEIFKSALGAARMNAKKLKK